MPTSVTVTGADAMQSSLKAAARKVDDMTAINREVAATVAAAVKAPRKTGRLAGSVRPQGTKNEAAVVVDQPYAGVIENGWAGHNISAFNFVKNAFASTESTTMAMYEKAMQSTLNDVKGA